MLPNLKSSGRMFCAAVSTAALILAASCTESDQTDPVHDPAFLGIVVNHRDGPGTDRNLSETYSTVNRGGFSCAQFGVEWGDVEPYAGARNWAETEHHAYQGRVRGLPLITQVLLMDKEVRGALPTDLTDRHWDDPTLQARLAMFLRDLDAHLQPGNTVFWLGREVDAYFAGNRGELAGFIGLLEEVRGRLRSFGVDTPVGVTISYRESVLGGRLDIADSLAGHVDLLGLSVYGRDPDYSLVLSPVETVDLVREAVGRFSGVRVVIAETGYPGDVESGVPQEEFARLLTRYLAARPANLLGAIWFCLHDWHLLLAEPESRRRHPDEPLMQAAYARRLRSLGVREVNGVARPAWYHLQAWNRGTAISAVATRGHIVQ